MRLYYNLYYYEMKDFPSSYKKVTFRDCSNTYLENSRCKQKILASSIYKTVCNIDTTTHVTIFSFALFQCWDGNNIFCRYRYIYLAFFRTEASPISSTTICLLSCSSTYFTHVCSGRPPMRFRVFLCSQGLQFIIHLLHRLSFCLFVVRKFPFYCCYLVPFSIYQLYMYHLSFH